MSTGRIVIHGPFPPPTGIVGPDARKTNSHFYNIYDDRGRRIIGGSFGPDRDRCEAFARRIAATEKGITVPTVEYVDP